MRSGAALAGLIWLFASSSAVDAEVLGSGALFDRDQKDASCTVSNVHSGPVPVRVRIFSSNGSPVSVPFDNCNGTPLAPERSCNVNANILSPDVLYFCKVDTGTSAGGRVRGTMIIYDSSVKILGTADLR